jgi:hypothetical protein
VCATCFRERWRVLNARAVAQRLSSTLLNDKCGRWLLRLTAVVLAGAIGSTKRTVVPVVSGVQVQTLIVHVQTNFLNELFMFTKGLVLHLS